MPLVFLALSGPFIWCEPYLIASFIESVRKTTVLPVPPVYGLKMEVVDGIATLNRQEQRLFSCGARVRLGELACGSVIDEFLGEQLAVARWIQEECATEKGCALNQALAAVQAGLLSDLESIANVAGAVLSYEAEKFLNKETRSDDV